MFYILSHIKIVYAGKLYIMEIAGDITSRIPAHHHEAGAQGSKFQEHPKKNSIDIYGNMDFIVLEYFFDIDVKVPCDFKSKIQ